MANYDQLLHTLSLNLGIPQEKLQAAIKSGDPNALLSLLDKEKSAALGKILSDPNALKKTLNSKQAKSIQKDLKP